MFFEKKELIYIKEKNMVIADFLERNARLYGDETALVEINRRKKGIMQLLGVTLVLLKTQDRTCPTEEN